VVPDLTPNLLGMRVGNEDIQWKEGKCVIFDDSYMHSVWHYGGKDSTDRIVLLFDFWHPELQPSEIEAITYCLAASNPSNKMGD